MLHNTSERRRRIPLPRSVVDVAYQEYVVEKISLRVLAKRHWREWGCSDPGRALSVIVYSFHNSGLAIRRPGRPETSGISKGRAPQRSTKRELSARVHAESKQRREEEIRLACRKRSSLRTLMQEQAQDDRRTQIQSSYVVSLDAARFEEGGAGDVLVEALPEPSEELGFVYTARRVGYDSWGAWIDALIERVDFWLLCNDVVREFELSRSADAA